MSNQPNKSVCKKSKQVRGLFYIYIFFFNLFKLKKTEQEHFGHMEKFYNRSFFFALYKIYGPLFFKA